VLGHLGCAEGDVSVSADAVASQQGEGSSSGINFCGLELDPVQCDRRPNWKS